MKDKKLIEKMFLTTAIYICCLWIAKVMVSFYELLTTFSKNIFEALIYLPDNQQIWYLTFILFIAICVTATSINIMFKFIGFLYNIYKKLEGKQK